MWFFVQSGGAAGHVQSLILSAMLFGMGAALTVVAFLGDLIAINRRMLEDLRLESRRRRFDAMRTAVDAPPRAMAAAESTRRAKSAG